MNLAINARDAMPDGGKLTIETANADLDLIYSESHGRVVSRGPYVLLAISDTGEGMPPEIQAQIFDPFFTTQMWLCLKWGVKKWSKNSKKNHPRLKVLYMSGYTANSIVHHGILDQGVAFIQKPFTPNSLARKVREVLDKVLYVS